MTATAKVTLTVEVNITDTWGEDCTVGQVRSQATASAVGALRRRLAEPGFNVLGEPHVSVVFLPLEGRTP